MPFVDVRLQETEEWESSWAERNAAYASAEEKALAEDRCWQAFINELLQSKQ